MRPRSKALMIARLRLLDAGRDRRAFLTSLFLPFLMLGLFAALGVAGTKSQKRENQTLIRVAVGRDVAGADHVLALLDVDPITIVRTKEPAGLVVRERADVALTVPAHADELLASGRQLRFEVLGGSGGRSLEGIASTEAALRRVALEQSGRRVPVAITTDRLERNPKAVASALSRTVPLLALIITLPFLGSGIRALTKSRIDRSIEHLLPLPMSRTTLLFGLAIGTIGGEAVQQLLLLAMLAVAAPALAASGAIPWSGPFVLALALVVSAMTAGSVGILLGVLARSERMVGLVFGVTGGLFAAAASALQFMDKAPHAPTVTAIPLVGPVLAARAAFTDDGLSTVALVTMVIGGLAATALSLQLAARRLSSGGGLRI